MMEKREIKELFDKAGASISQDDLWAVQGVPVVKHKAVERLGAALKIRFQQPLILRSERDEAVILATGVLGEVTEWSIGEACVNVNYLVKGKMSAYVYAMAEKRARGRVILKLAGLHGVYSEEEADEFKSHGETQPATSPVEAASSLASKKYMELALPIVERTKSAADLKEWWDKEKPVRDDILDDLQYARLKQVVTDKVTALKAKETVNASV